jgi:hypothetical protein
MHRSRDLAIAILGFTLYSCSAKAAPLSFQLQDWTGVAGYQENAVVPLPDPSVGGTVNLWSFPIHWGPGWAFPIAIEDPPNNNPAFQFTISVQNPSDPSASYPSLTVYGHLNEAIGVPIGSPPLNNGSFTGEATSIQVNSPPGTSLPPQLLDLVSDPSRIQIIGVGTLGNDVATVQVSLEIDPPPPVPIPEPTATITMIIGFAALALRLRAKPKAGQGENLARHSRSVSG